MLQNRASNRMLTCGSLSLFFSGKVVNETLSSLTGASSSPCVIYLGPAAMAVGGTAYEALCWERVGRHCLHRARYHQNQHEMATLQFIAEWKWKLWALPLH